MASKAHIKYSVRLMAARVGTGNMAGIAVALSVGGPGAIFWMCKVIALFSMATAFIESTLAQVYKVKDVDGQRTWYACLLHGKRLRQALDGYPILSLFNHCFRFRFQCCPSKYNYRILHHSFRI